MSVDMSAFTSPRSDQANYDDFIGGPRTITITAVRANEGSKEQPISISYEGDNGKPYKPCLSMRRVMVNVWGSDANQYIGRSMTLYGDPEVIWGGLKVGGIRISHMSHMDKTKVMALTASKTARKPFTVQPLVIAPDITAQLIAAYEAATTEGAWNGIEVDRAAQWKKIPTDDKPRVKAASDAAKVRITQQAPQ